MFFFFFFKWSSEVIMCGRESHMSFSSLIRLICHCSIRQPVWVPGLFFVLVTVSSTLCSSEEEMWGKNEARGLRVFFINVRWLGASLSCTTTAFIDVKVTVIKCFDTLPCQAIIMSRRISNIRHKYYTTHLKYTIETTWYFHFTIIEAAAILSLEKFGCPQYWGSTGIHKNFIQPCSSP